MRLKRNDIVKQFDTVVQQEITNHNKQIEATNTCLQDIKRSIDVLTVSHAKQIAIFDSRLRKREMELEKLQQDFDKLSQKLFHDMDKCKEDVSQTHFSMSVAFQDLESNVVYQDDFSESVSSIKQELSYYKQDLGNQKVYIHAELVNIGQEFERLLSEFKEDIINRPNELWEVKNNLEKKISEAVVDAKGIMRSLEAYKRESFVMEKKIENLYTITERLKKRVD